MADVVIGRVRGETYIVREEGEGNGVYDAGDQVYRQDASGRQERIDLDPARLRHFTQARLGLSLQPGVRLHALHHFVSAIYDAAREINNGGFDAALSQLQRGLAAYFVAGPRDITSRNTLTSLFDYAQEHMESALVGAADRPEEARHLEQLSAQFQAWRRTYLNPAPANPETRPHRSHRTHRSSHRSDDARPTTPAPVSTRRCSS